MSMVVKKSDLIIWGMLFFLVIPTTVVAHYSWLLFILRFVRLFALLYAAYLLINERVVWNAEILPWLVWIAWACISTILNSGDITGLISLYYPIISGIVLLQYAMNIDPSDSVKKLAFLFMLVVFVNMISWFNGGLYINTAAEFGDSPEVYFIGIRVTINRIAIPAIAVTYIAKRIGGRKENIVFLITLLCTISFILLEWVSTAIVAVALMGLLFLLWMLSGRGTFFKYSANILTVLLITLSFFIIYNSNIIDSFSWLIEGILNKSTTLTGRTDIWKSVLSQVNGIDWLIGHGYGTERSFKLANGLVTGATHSDYLLSIYNYGIIGLGIFLFQLFAIIKRSYEFIETRISKCLVAAVLSVLCTCISAAVSEYIYFPLFWIVAINLEKYISEENYTSCTEENKISVEWW